MKKKSIFRALALIMVIGAATSASAVATEPGAFKNYLEVFMQMIKGTAGNLAMVMIIVFAAIKAWQIGDKAPFMWGAAAVVGIAAAPYIAPNLTTNMSAILGF